MSSTCTKLSPQVRGIDGFTWVSTRSAFSIPDLIRTKINLLPEGISEVRTVEIVGLDLQADGGTHVANTREVGRIRIPNYKSKGRINKRIYIELDPLSGAEEDAHPEAREA